MIKSFIFENFKSFERAELNLEAVTSLIGSNASGKSNAVEGIQILSELAAGADLSVVLDGTRSIRSHVRGGSAGCCRFKTSSFKLGCLVDWDQDGDLYYYIKIGVHKRVQVEEEALYKVRNGKTTLSGGEKIFKTKPVSKESGDISAEYNDKKPGRNPDILCIRAASVLTQMNSKLPQNTDRDRECLNYIRHVLENLKGIFVLNPVPGDMRDYVRLTDTEMKGNAENISSVLYHLCQDKNIKSTFMDIICNLPENEIKGIEFVKTSLDDVIFGLREKYAGASEIVDAKKLSDGTLRCIAAAAAVLSIPEQSTLVVEEIDNGIHPGRVSALISRLSELAAERQIDIILTTHNPVLLNGYDKEKLLGVSVVYREQKKGDSLFIPFVDIKEYPRLLAKGGVGDALTDDSLIRMIRLSEQHQDNAEQGV